MKICWRDNLAPGSLSLRGSPSPIHLQGQRHPSLELRGGLRPDSSGKPGSYFQQWGEKWGSRRSPQPLSREHVWAQIPFSPRHGDLEAQGPAWGIPDERQGEW